MESLERLARLFLEFPGIGSRQSKRFAYFLAGQPKEFVSRLRDALREVEESSGTCPQCFRTVLSDAGEVCRVCKDTLRDHTQLLILERDTDFETVHNAGLYKGGYFILGGAIPFVDEGSVAATRLAELEKRLSKKSDVQEVILACSYTAEGEHTAHRVKDTLGKIAKGSGIKITELARGLSTGTELEYSDTQTLEHALKNRK